ncbi:MAG: ATP-binding protein, partial [Bacteroidota bacterium]
VYGVPKENILTLRRHEKDYIIRKEPHYGRMLEEKVTSIIESLEANRQLSAQQLEQSTKLLSNYLVDFKQLQRLEKEIGLNQRTGLQKETANVLATLTQEVERFVLLVSHNIDQNEAKQKTLYFWMAVLLIVFSIALSFWMAKAFTKPIDQIQQSMAHFTENAFETKLPVEQVRSKNELQRLQQDWNQMANEIQEKIVALQNENQNLRNSNKHLETFSYIVSHDLKSPLRSINSFVGLLKNKLKDYPLAEAREYMQYIQGSTVKMTHLINDLLAFSKLNAQELVVQRNVFDELMEEVRDTLAFQIDQTEASIEIFNQPIILYCDAIKIKRVFQNLISNAMKYVADGIRPEVKINCKGSSEYWQFSIEDNGLGLDEEQQKRLFQPFEQLHDTHKYEGSGLGLSICKKIIEKHKGSIWMESELGKGSIFYVTIAKSFEATYQEKESVAATGELMEA